MRLSDLDERSRAHIARDIEALASEFAGIASHAQVAECVEATLAEMPPPKVQTYVPLIVHRRARAVLQDQAAATPAR